MHLSLPACPGCFNFSKKAHVDVCGWISLGWGVGMTLGYLTLITVWCIPTCKPKGTSRGAGLLMHFFFCYYYCCDGAGGDRALHSGAVTPGITTMPRAPGDSHPGHHRSAPRPG